MLYKDMKKEGKITIKVPVDYAMYGTVEVVVDSYEELGKLMADNEFIESMPIPDDAEYIDASYIINAEQLEYEINELKTNPEGKI